jgi:succinate dehydrogenase / fumarate reductase membrane anchor subunit
MANYVTSLTGNGLKDWLLQRISAVYLLVYTVFLVAFCAMHAPLTLVVWQALFACHVMKVATLIAFLMIMLHAWIGLWTVMTDYIKCAMLRLVLLSVLAFWLLAQFIWGIFILWGQ